MEEVGEIKVLFGRDDVKKKKLSGGGATTKKRKEKTPTIHTIESQLSPVPSATPDRLLKYITRFYLPVLFAHPNMASHSVGDRHHRKNLRS